MGFVLRAGPGDLSRNMWCFLPSVPDLSVSVCLRSTGSATGCVGVSCTMGRSACAAQSKPRPMEVTPQLPTLAVW